MPKEVFQEVNLTEIQKSYLNISRRISSTVLTDEDNERYSEFVRWLNNINQLAEDFYTQDQDGKYPVMDQTSLNAFKSSYQRALEECDNVLAENSDDGISARMKEIAAEVRKHLLRDSVAFESFVIDENNPRSLDELISLGRSLTVDVGQQELSSMGGQLSSRIPIKVPGAPQGDLDGFFTKASYVNTEDSVKKLHEKLNREHPALTELFESLRNAKEEKLYNNGLLEVDMYEAIARGAQRAGAQWPETKEGMAQYATSYFKNALSRLLPKETVNRLIAEPDFLAAVDEYYREMKQIRSNKAIYTEDGRLWLGVPEGSNIDKRNAAMSSVSTLLGKKGLIAEAQPMVVLINGQPTAGTFMNRANGFNADDRRENNPMLSAGKEVYDNSAVFDDVSALQAIDFICGNLDRHPGNFMLHFSGEKGKEKLEGIVAIDNDLSFGLNVPQPLDKGHIGNKFIFPEDMGAIGEQTAQKIASLKEEELKLTLRGYGLSKEEMDAAWKRTQMMQQAILEGMEFYKDKEAGIIEKGHLRVVPEKDWDKYELADLANDTADSKRMNQFATLLNMKSIIEKRKKEEDLKALRNTRTKQVRQVLFGEQPKAVKTEPVTAVPVGTGIKYRLGKVDRLGVDNPENVRVVVPANSVLSSSSGNNNERIPLSYIGKDGKPVEGFFTSSVKIDGKVQIKRMFEKEIQRQSGENGNPERAEIIRRTYEYWKQNPGNRYRSKNFDYLKIGFDKETAERYKADKQLSSYYRNFLGSITLAEKMYRDNYTDIGANMEGSIDKRNVAMSKMSDLLGVPKCIARATTMQVQGAEGKITEGVFMEKAPGKSFMDINPGDEAAKLNTALFDGSPALKDLADIQIMDYICMNVDRNESNLFYNFSEDGKKCIGVTGIDNDLSFGTVRLASDRSINWDTPLDNITVVSEAMASKIANMRETALRNTLDGQGLTDKEMDAAMDRFVNVQEKIKSGQIRVVKDEEWAEMKLSDLAQGKKNIFSNVTTSFTESLLIVLEDKEKANEPAKEPIKFPVCERVEEFDEEALRKTEFERVSQEEEASFLKGLRDQFKEVEAGQPKTDAAIIGTLARFAKNYNEHVKDGNSIFHGASQFYIDLNTRAREFSEKIRQLNQKVKRNEQLGDEDYSAIVVGINNLRTAATNYKEHVKGIEHPSRTQKKRLGIVNGLSESLETVSRMTQTNVDKREIINKPEEFLFRKLHGKQAQISNEQINEEDFKRHIAGMIYMTGLSQNVVSLTKDQKLVNAMLKTSFNRNRDQILADPAFNEMMQNTDRGQLVSMATAGSGEKLLQAYTRQRAVKKTNFNDLIQQDGGANAANNGNRRSVARQHDNANVRQRNSNLP